MLVCLHVISHVKWLQNHTSYAGKCCCTQIRIADVDRVGWNMDKVGGRCDEPKERAAYVQKQHKSNDWTNRSTARKDLFSS